jgi:hypothetical protein
MENLSIGKVHVIITANAILEIQDIIEKILYKRRVDPGGYKYDFRLRMPTYFDPLIGRRGNQGLSEQNGDLILFVKKHDRYIRIGQYNEDNGDLTSDPVIAIDYNYGKWIPIRIERVIGETVYSHIENGRRVMYPDKIEEFMSFQGIFAQYIREQGWLENGIRLKRK